MVFVPLRIGVKDKKPLINFPGNFAGNKSRKQKKTVAAYRHDNLNVDNITEARLFVAGQPAAL